MKKTCLLLILLLGFTAINSMGYVILYPGVEFYNDDLTVKFGNTDGINVSYLEVGDQYIVLGDLNLSLSGTGAIEINLSQVNDNHTVLKGTTVLRFNATTTNTVTYTFTGNMTNPTYSLYRNNILIGTYSSNSFSWTRVAGQHDFDIKISTMCIDPPTDGISTLSPPYNGTLILRPNSSGTYTSIPDQYPASGSHYDKIDDVTHDSDNTYVYTSDTDMRYDTYGLPDHTSETEAIHSVIQTVVIRTVGGSYGDYNYIITDGINDQIAGTYSKFRDGWGTFTHTWSTAPDGTSWDWTDIDNLQIGIGMRRGTATLVRCTQTFVTIQYQTAIDYCDINLTWVDSDDSDREIVVMKSGGYPSSPSDGFVCQNSTNEYYNFTVDSTIGYFSVWSYNSTYHAFSCTGLDIPWGTLQLNVFNASQTWESIDPFGLTIQNTAGDDIYQKSTCSPPLFLDLNDIPTGSDTIFIINASEYETQTYRRDTVTNTFMNFTFLLPPVKTSTPGAGDDDSENHTDSLLYLITLLNEVDQSLMDGLIVFSLYVNQTDTYEQVGSFITDGAGQGTIWLVPNKLYKVVCSVPNSDSYQTNTSYWTPSSQLLTKTFKLKYAEDDIRPPKIPQDYITFTTSRTNTSLTVIYDDALLETIDTVIYIYEINLSTGLETLFHTNRTTGVNSFTLTVNGLEANNSYRICLKYNHTTFGYQDPTRLEEGYRRILTTASEFNVMMTNIFGYNPLVWSHLIMLLILIAGMFFADKEDIGKILIILGGIFLFVNVSIGFDDALTSAAGGIIPILFILVGILMEWKKGRVN